MEGWRGKDADTEDGEARGRKEKRGQNQEEQREKWAGGNNRGFKVTNHTNLMRSIRELAAGSFIKV